ncbi:MAG: sigma-70 family RNA polymerase sigma factor, partial [Gammaproteobacteria bacterium]|nr:sigma-70 family RNA polymerase sigma factor [Gammaproteobacteria bacterium]
MTSAIEAKVYEPVLPNGEASDENLTAVVVRYAPLVKRIAHHLLLRMPASVQIDDLIQSGMIGLLEAAKKYDVSKGASFETYAGIRIRGSMLDEVR